MTAASFAWQTETQADFGANGTAGFEGTPRIGPRGDIAGVAKLHGVSFNCRSAGANEAHLGSNGSSNCSSTTKSNI